MIKIHVFESIRRTAEKLLGNFKKVIAAPLYNCIEPDKNVNYTHPIIRPSERLNEQNKKFVMKGRGILHGKTMLQIRKKNMWVRKSMPQ